MSLLCYVAGVLQLTVAELVAAHKCGCGQNCYSYASWRTDATRDLRPRHTESLLPAATTAAGIVVAAAVAGNSGVEAAEAAVASASAIAYAVAFIVV